MNNKKCYYVFLDYNKCPQVWWNLFEEITETVFREYTCL